MSVAESEAKRLRRDLAREMFADCESELRLEKQAVTKAEARITTLEGQIRRLEAELRENEHARLSLISKMEILEASELALEKERADRLNTKLERTISDLNRVGRSAANANAATAEAKEEAEEFGRENVVLIERVEKLEAERGELQKNIESINGRAEKAAQASAAKISTLQSELSASRAQVAAILQGIADTQGDSGKE